MASIMKRGNTYSVRYNYKDHAGKPCKGWESFKTKKEAQDRKISVEKELLDGTFLIPDAMTVAEMLYKWLPIQSSKHKWAPKTYTHTVAMIQNLVVPYLGKKQIQKVQTYDLEQFYATLSRTPRGLYKQGVKQTLTDKQKRQFLTGVGLVENGSWAPMAANKMKAQLASMKNMKIVDPIVKIQSSVSEENLKQLEVLAKELAANTK